MNSLHASVLSPQARFILDRRAPGRQRNLSDLTHHVPGCFLPWVAYGSTPACSCFRVDLPPTEFDVALDDRDPAVIAAASDPGRESAPITVRHLARTVTIVEQVTLTPGVVVSRQRTVIRSSSEFYFQQLAADHESQEIDQIPNQLATGE